jgi:uncharacterized repeat protein (TIGR03899 family)
MDDQLSKMLERVKVNIDTKDLSDPIVKLIETTKFAFSRWYEPIHMRRLADAKSHQLIKEARTEIEVHRIRLEGIKELEIPQDIRMRVASRVNNQEVRRQQNIESIISDTPNYLPPSVTPEPVDEDFIYQYFNYCQDIGNPEMQSLWARLLAGEITEPGTYSSRTLNVLRDMRSKDANLFNEYCKFICKCRTDNNVNYNLYHIAHDEVNNMISDLGLTYEDLSHLRDIGLIDNPERKYMAGPEGFISGNSITIDFGETMVKIGHSKRIDLSIRRLTDVGEELYTLTNRISDRRYMNLLITIWTEKNDYSVDFL